MSATVPFVPCSRLAPFARGLFILLCLLISNEASWSDPVPVYKDPAAPLEARVNDLFDRLTPDERLTLLTGTAFTTTPIPRLEIPGMGMADAGQGVRGGTAKTLGPATLFPCGTTMASSWDRDLLARVGKAIGEEAINKGEGAQVLLGPAVNIHRTPLGGRNGEYFSEDPYLTGQMAVSYIQGMQSTGCAACVKHYACNNQEFDRRTVNVQVDERALREIYLPAFEAAVKQGHVWTLMASYNKVNGLHATANGYLLSEILKREWGFDGLVVSDWGAVHETARVVNAGTDLEMPGPGYLSRDRLAKALANGTISQASVDDSVHRILRALIRTGVIDGPRRRNRHIVNSPEHSALAFEAASKGIVLLKNTGGILPLDASKIRSLAVIGQTAKTWQMGAGGSPYVTPLHAVSGYQGIKDRVNGAFPVDYGSGPNAGWADHAVPASALTPSDGTGHGLSGEYYSGVDLSGDPIAARTDAAIKFDWDDKRQRPRGVPHELFSVRWTGTLTAPETGRYRFIVSADDGCRLFLGGRLLTDSWIPSNGSGLFQDVDLVAGQSYPIRLDYFQAGGRAFTSLCWVLPHENIFSDAIKAAQTSDAAIVFVGSGGEGEGVDRTSMALPSVEAELIHAVAAVNKKTIVVLNNGGPLLLSDWRDEVPSVIEANFPGQEGGAALAAILFGDVDPSGKLTDTIAAAREDYPDFGNYPGTDGQVNYAEGIYVGYRYFDKQQIAPLYPFGYGLSYTTFRYSNMKILQPIWNATGAVTVTTDITNTGPREGAEVAELYVHCLQPKIDRPIRELKGFAKMDLAPGETQTATFILSPRDFAYCDVANKQWKADSGDYEVEIGASSRDLRLTAPLTLTQDYTEAVPGMGAPPVVPPITSLTTDRPVFASSSLHGSKPEYVVDGDDDTRWESAWSDPQWLAVDLGSPKRIDHASISWEAAYARSYAVQVSDDGQAWHTVYATDHGMGGMETLLFAPVTAQWVRLYMTKRGTIYGYSLYGFDVDGPRS